MKSLLSDSPPGRDLPWLRILSLGLLVATAAAFVIGPFPIAPGELLSLLWNRLFGGTESAATPATVVVFQVRLPRVAAAVLAGAALAAAGGAYQGMFRNPLVSPDILGVSAGAALGAVLGIYTAQRHKL